MPAWMYVRVSLPGCMHTLLNIHICECVLMCRRSYRSDSEYMYTCIDVYVSLKASVYIGVHTGVNTYIHTRVHTCIHAYMHTYRSTYVHTYRHTYIMEYSIPLHVQLLSKTVNESQLLELWGIWTQICFSDIAQCHCHAWSRGIDFSNATLYTYIHTYIHIHKHTHIHIHTYKSNIQIIQTYIHTWIGIYIPSIHTHIDIICTDHTYRAYIHTYIHTYIHYMTVTVTVGPWHAYIVTCKHAYIHTYIHTCIHTYR